MKKLIFATANQNKVAEIKSIVPAGYQISSLHDIGFTDELPETQMTLEDNAKQKATYLFDRIHIPCFSEDTGLEVEALNGAPGVHSARYAGMERDHNKNIELLLQNLKDAPIRKARFRTCICYIDDQGIARFFEGSITGSIVTERKGDGGFGYDPVFQPDGFNITFAQMASDTKSVISHRGKAFQKFISFIGSRAQK